MSTRRCSHVSLAGIAALSALALSGFAPARAAALADNSAWTVSAVATPTNFAPGNQSGEDAYEVMVTNSGDGPSNGEPVTVTDVLPAGLKLAGAGMSGEETLSHTKLSCAGSACTYTGVVPAGDMFTLTVPVDVEATEAGELGSNVVTVAGGGAEGSASTPTTISERPSPGFGLAPGSFSTTLSNTQAGAHADLTTSFYFDTDGPFSARGSVEGSLKDTVVDLPVGFAGDPAAASTCSAAQLAAKGSLVFTECPLNSQVGTVTVLLGGPVSPAQGRYTTPLYNMQPLGGEVARLGFSTFGFATNIVMTVRPGGYGLQATSPNLGGGTGVEGASLTVWGIPADPSHNLMRGTICYPGTCENPSHKPVGEGIADSEPAEPFLSNPTACTPLGSTLRIDSWENPLSPAELLASPPAAEAGVGPMSGCERLEFNPSMTVQPTSVAAETPTGLNVGLTLPQTYENPTALATSHLKDVTVELPEGMTVNPSAGAGMGACSPAQYEAETVESAPGAGCPNNSTLGTVVIHTPVLKEEATGSIFLATSYDNPFSEEGHPGGSLIAVYVVARIKDRGLLVKVAGKITADPITGRLTTTFKDDPQLPFDKFTLKFNPGQAAPLVTPPVCGQYSAHTAFTSWSEPEAVIGGLTPPFSISERTGGGECVPGEAPGFSPKIVTAGTMSNAAGSYSPFYMRIERKDGEEEIARFSTTMPPGLSGNLSGIPFCPEAAIEAARKASGREELEHPSCPAASEVGHTLVGAGVGGTEAQTPGKIYLAGPYNGAPLSIVSVTSATVGPFDLGTVVIRFALRINPRTAQVEVDGANSDPIPHIIRGIVVHVRDIRVYINRPNFTINPTNCNPMSIEAAISAAAPNPANPSQAPASVAASEHFQAADCANLAFKPSLKATTSAHATRRNGASLTTTLTFPQPPKAPQGSEANIAKVKVELPKQLPSELRTLQKACKAAVFEANPAACPAASVVGRAKATTPILPVPMEGPAYFVSHGGEAFPSLVVVLQASGPYSGITIDLTGTTFISKRGITSSTFKTIPDVPVGTFTLTLPQGPNSALAAVGNLCKAHLKMPTTFTAQSGAVIAETTKIKVTGCPKKKPTPNSRKKGGKR